MSHTILAVSLAAVMLALLASLFTNARQFFDRQAQNDDIKVLQERLIGPGGHLTDAVENSIRTFDSVLEGYRRAFGNQEALDKIVLRNLGEDLPVLSRIDGYARSAGWPRAFAVLAGIRVRMIIAKFVLTNSSAVSEEVRDRIGGLLQTFQGFSALAGLYYDFSNTHLLAIKPLVESQNAWPEVSAAEIEAASTETQAKELMKLLGRS